MAAKGTTYVFQLYRLSSTAKGLPLWLMHQLYMAVAIPKMLYTADLWFTPTYRNSMDQLQHRSIKIARKLSRVQCIAAITITGAMRTTVTDVLEVHANLLPISLLLQNICHRAIVHIATHPNFHPLYLLIHWAAKHYMQSHRSSLHCLTRQFCIDPQEIETLIPDRKPPTSSLTIAWPRLSRKNHIKASAGIFISATGSSCTSP